MVSFGQDTFASVAPIDFYQTFFSHLGYIGLLWLFTIMLYKKTKIKNLLAIFFGPLLVILICFFIYGDFHYLSIATVVPCTLIIYILTTLLFFEDESVDQHFGYMVFGILGVFTILANLYFVSGDLTLTPGQLFSLFLASLVFLLGTYYFSFKENLSYLYLLGTGGTILTLLPLLQIEGPRMSRSIAMLAITGVSNVLLPIINKNLLKGNSTNIIF